jgi:hypothetical protein
MKQQFRIRTYDSIPTDLAGEMHDWPEFASGQGYTVHLRGAVTGAEVSVWMIEPENDLPTVIVEGTHRSSLLDRVLGRVVQALSEHSDDVDVRQSTIAEPDGASNRSQPVGPRTNGTSSAAGSGG